MTSDILKHPADDWLDDKYAGARQDMKQAQIEFAKLHMVFVTNPAAAELLQHWVDLAERRVPVGSSLDVYARTEALRAFMKTIKEQIEIAKSHD